MPFSPETLLKRCPPDLARRAIVARFDGADKTALALEGGLLVRFARNEAAAATLRTEARLLAALRGKLPLAIPEIRYAEPGLDCYLMIPGVPFTASHWEKLTGKKRHELTHSLADFLAALHQALTLKEAERIALSPSRWPLSPGEMRAILAGRFASQDEAFVETTLTRWEALASPPEEKRVLHNDLGGHNFAFDDVSSRLVGIFDFGDACVGNLHQDFHYFDGYGLDFARRIEDAYALATGIQPRREEIALRHAANVISHAAFAVGNPQEPDPAEKPDWIRALRRRVERS